MCSSKECQVRHWQCHKLVCQDNRKDSFDFTSTESSKGNKARFKSNVNLSAECSSNMLLMRPSLSIDDSTPEGKICQFDSKTKVNNKQDGFQDLSTCIDKGCLGKAEGEKDGEKTSGCEHPSDQMIEGISSISLKESKKVEDVFGKETVRIVIKHNKVKHELCVPRTKDGKTILQVISDAVSIPVSKLKLVHKGKMATCDNIQGMLFNRALFLAFGEISESEEGLEKADIDLIVKQLDVERNLAVKVLRRTGNVLDAIIEIGNM